MSKGLFTQCVCFLTDGTTSIEDLRVRLEAKDFTIAKKAQAQSDWRLGGPTLVVPYDPDVNGFIAIDVVNEPWPDSMGDPERDKPTFSAWMLGHFGPFVFPGSLKRAGEHSWGWKEGKTIAEKCRGFVRMRLSYGFGAKEDDKLKPDNYEPLAELIVLNKVVQALFRAPGVLCYFNPNGEVLRDWNAFRDYAKACEADEAVPISLWSNIRFAHLNDKYFFMDTIGNAQMDIPDVEAIYPRDKYKAEDIDAYLGSVTNFVLGVDHDLKTGEEIDGPVEGEMWTIEMANQSAMDPPRKVVRLYPKEHAEAIKQGLEAIGKT